MFRRKREPADFRAEIEAHLQFEIERLMEHGLSKDDARAAARRSFGNIARAQEQFYERSSWIWWDILRRDIRFGLRMLRRNSSVAAVVVATLALGVGASTALFSIADGVLRKDPDWYRTGAVMGWEPERNLRIFRFSIPEFVELSRLSDIFETSGALYWSNAALTTGDYPERVGVAHVMPSVINQRKVPPQLGRFYREDEDRPGGPQVAVISDELWQSHFAADREVIGKRIRLDGLNYTVIGVACPRESTFGSGVMVPAQLDLANQDRSRRNLWVLVTLKKGVSWGQADTRLNGLARNITLDNRTTHPEYTGLELRYWNGYDAGTAGVRPVFILLLAAVAVLLVIACANIAILLLARASSRRQEFTMRAALGAGRLRLIRQLLTESVLLAMAGGIAGILVARLCLPFLLHLIPASTIDTHNVYLNVRVLCATIGLTLSIGLVFGFAPAWCYSRANPDQALKQGGSRMGADRGGRLTRQALVVSEIALTLLVLGSAALMIESYRNLERMDLGFQPEHVLSLQISLPGKKYSTPAQIVGFFRTALERVKALPGVDGAAVVSGLPMMDRTVDLATRDFTIEGHPIETGNGLANANLRVASAGYFDVVSARLIRGRLFTDQDGPGTPRVAVINETMARLYWPGVDPLGARIHLAGAESREQSPDITIVGVVSDMKQIRVIDAPVRQELYLPQLQFATLLPGGLAVAGNGEGLTMMVRSSRDTAALTSSIRHVIQSIDAEQPIYDVRMMSTVVSDAFGPKRIATVLLSFFALVALLLSTIGTYAVMAYSVSQRTREIGLRMALGAQRYSILILIMRNGIVLALAGLGLGALLALLLAQLIFRVQYGLTPVGLFYGVSSSVPVTLIAIVALLLFLALAACYVPAARAMRVDPIVTLREG